MGRKVSLYIEDTEIKLLITNNNKVEKWASLLLEPKLVRDGVIIDEEQVANGIGTTDHVTGRGIRIGLHPKGVLSIPGPFAQAGSCKQSLATRGGLRKLVGNRCVGFQRFILAARARV